MLQHPVYVCHSTLFCVLARVYSNQLKQQEEMPLTTIAAVGVVECACRSIDKLIVRKECVCVSDRDCKCL